ncbi:MAG: hypothetical protein OXF56_05800 [Rhodobacteraceae bacterium]|nr:hypothetical protein [Paracoccaceae bacterium]
MQSMNYPMLARDRLDYLEGAYEARVKRSRDGTGMRIRHVVAGSNLVATMLKRNDAAFAVEVTSPYATYRQFRQAGVTGVTELTQEVSWKAEDIVPPVYVRPLVIATISRPISLTLNGKHGVHEVWRGSEISLAAGMILAQDQFWRATSTWESLIRLVSEETFEPGRYRVELNTGEGFHFKVLMNPKLFAWMVNPGDAKSHRDSILTGCLARALEMIHAEFGKDDSWQEFPVLRALHRRLIDSGLPTWQNNQSFCADDVASRLKPIEFLAEHNG